MAAGNRNKNTNKRSDIAKHYSSENGGAPICGQKRYGYSTNDKSEVCCLNCIKKMKTNPPQ